MQPEKFEFGRSRGLVWVCDLAGSSRHLNDKDSVDAFEAFLPRLHWMSALVVDAAGGKFIKWTGDGFLAWFETPLHREIGKQAAAVFEAIWHLTVLVNVTQLCVTSDRKFRIRHGVTHEQDALTTKITYPTGFELLDLTGRAVVLAFRLSGIPVDFPGIVTERALADASRGFLRQAISFERWKPTSDENMKFFKGEKWGTSGLCVSRDRKPVRRSPKSILKQAKEAIAEAESDNSSEDLKDTFGYKLVVRMACGPKWCRDVESEYVRYLREDLMGSLKAALPFLEKLSKGEPESEK